MSVSRLFFMSYAKAKITRRSSHATDPDTHQASKRVKIPWVIPLKTRSGEEVLRFVETWI